MFKKNKRAESGITLIEANCEITGDLHFSDQLQVNGLVNGNIYAKPGSKATVTVSQKGQVSGEIRVPNVVVNGKVMGDIRADEHVELAAKAEVKGNIYYNSIEMVKGSRAEGQIVLIEDSEGEATKQAQGNQQEVAEPKPPRAVEKPEEEMTLARSAAAKVKSAVRNKSA